MRGGIQDISINTCVHFSSYFSLFEMNVSSNKALTNIVQEQNSASDLTSTPNAHEGQEPTLDAFQELRMSPRSHIGYKEAKPISKNNIMGMIRQTEQNQGHRAFCQPADFAKPPEFRPGSSGP